MATVNEIVTKYKTQGSEKVVKETDRIGKAQTRLGQGSASAGRSFSSQAQGLGGLVGVYAAAAANVFAISAAFAALNRAAQFATIIKGTEQLAAAVGSSATVVVSELKRVTQGQLSVIEAATQANLALSAGFNTDQISQLGDVANKAAKALGRNLTDAFQRITRGAIKLEPELLDEIGIFTRINPALEAYALQLGKSVSQLTQFERRQAFVNQVIKDGQQAFQDVDVSGKSTQATFEKLVANFTDLALIVGQFVADSLVPLAEFLDKNLGNRLILLGGIATLVFSALGKAIGTTAVAAFTRLGEALNRTADGFALNKKAASEFAERAKNVGTEFVGGGLVRGERGAGAQIKKDLAGGTITTDRALEIRSKIPNLIKAERAEQLKLRADIKAGNIERAKGTKLIQMSVQRTRALASTQRLVKDQLNASGKAAIGFAGGLRVAGKAAAFVATQIGKAFRLLNILLIAFTTLQTVLSFFDIDFFEILKTLITGIGKEARDAAKGVKQLAESTDLVKSRFEGLSDVSQEAALKQFARAAGKNLRTITRDIRAFEKDLERLNAGGFARFIRFFTTDEAKIAKLIEETKGKIAGLEQAADPAATKVLALGSAFIKLQEATGKSGETLSKSIDSNRIVKEGNKLVAKLNDIEVVIGSFQGKIAVLGDKRLVKLGQSLAEAGDKSDKLFQTLISGGNISAERASRDFGTIISLLTQAEKAAKDAGNVDLANKIGDQIDKTNEKVGKLVGEFTTLDALNKQLAKEFSSEFKFLDDRFLKGVASAETGKIAKNAEEQLKFRSENLALLTKQLDLEARSGTNLSKVRQLEEIISKTRKKAQADLIKVVPLLEKQRLSLQKGVESLEKQLELLTLQNQVLENQIESQKKLDALRLKEADQKNAINIQKANLDLTKAQLSNAEKIRDAELKSLETAEKLRAARADASISGARDAAGLADQRGEMAVSDARTKAAKFERDNVLSRRSILNNQIELARIERDAGLDRLDRQEALLIREVAENKKKNDAQLEIIKKQGEVDLKKIDDQITLLRKQELITIAEADLRKAQEKTQLETIKAAKNNIRDQETVAILQAKQQRATRDAQLELLKKQAELQQAKIKSDLFILRGQEINLRKQAQILSKTLKGPSIETEIGSGINTQLKAIGDNIGLINQQFSLSEKIFDQTVQKATLNATKGIEAEDTKEKILNKSIKANEKLDIAQADVFKERIKGLILEKTAIINATLEAIKMQGVLNKEEEAAAFTKFARLSQERTELQKVYDQLVDKGEAELSYASRVTEAIRSAKGIVANELSAAFSRLNDALVEGTLNAKNFRDGITEFVGGTLKKVQQDFFKQTIADPAAEFLTDTLFEGLGLQKETKPKVFADGATYFRGELIDGKGTDIIKKTIDDSDHFFSKFSENLDNLGSKAGDVIKGIGTSFMNALGGGGSNVLSAISTTGPNYTFGFDSLTMPEAFRGLASGGKVRKMAAGGMNRDRVPALLEPGEFVMKRSAARSIGDGNLSAMNSTGQMGGNVSVNIMNQGTPQEATEQSQPRFDGEKFVIDIVTRDLRNNGPIRKSLRGAS